jgi:hypothetical protein
MESTKANLYLVNTNQYPLTFEFVKRTLPGLYQALKRGDMIEDIGCQNSKILSYNPTGIYFYDGKSKLELPDLDSKIYACVPSTFKAVTEFPLRYWSCSHRPGVPQVNVIDTFDKGYRHTFYWHDHEDPWVAISVKALGLSDISITKTDGLDYITFECGGKYILFMETDMDHVFSEDLLWVLPDMFFLPDFIDGKNYNHNHYHDFADKEGVPYENMMWTDA